MERAFLENLQVNEQALPEEVIQAILQQHQKELADVTFAGVLSGVIREAGGRNEKAVTALLDLDSIRASDHVKQAAEQAVQQLKKEQAYLFFAPAPRYAPGTGTGNFEKPEPKSLADALREKFQR